MTTTINYLRPRDADFMPNQPSSGGADVVKKTTRIPHNMALLSNTGSHQYLVIKRDGTSEEVSFDKIKRRLSLLCQMEPALNVNVIELTKKVISGLYNGVTTTQLDHLAAETAVAMGSLNPAFSSLASRILVSDLQKTTPEKFSDSVKLLHAYVNEKTGLHSPLVHDDLAEIVAKHAEVIDAYIHHERDYRFTFFGLKTLQRAYLMQIDGGRIVERPQYMWMRVALGLHGWDMEAAFDTYDYLSQGFFTHATPTLYNGGTPNPQMSSCFLLQMTEDSIRGIYDTLKRCALVSKSAGGIGLAVHRIRSANSYIRGTGGFSNGLIPMLRVYNDTARYVDQGGGKRKGAFAIYLEPWHSDIFEFLQLRKNNGKEEERARDLFYGLWVPDLFMKRVEADADWTLFCPNEAPGLFDCWGEKFERLYEQYERDGKARRVVRAQELWRLILTSQIETGMPYMLYKDSCNRKSNHQHLGTIQSSNLCTEVVQYTSPDEVAVCNLASIALPMFVSLADGGKSFDFVALHRVAKTVTRNLNKLIDLNYYPIPEAETSNRRHRPIGMGVQGLADVFLLMRFAWESPEARQLNRDIFETIYHAGLEASMELAQKEGVYPTYEGSPVSRGILQPDMWGVVPSNRWDWKTLRENIATHGVRNSLLVAPMPTASTSQILGNNECFEAYTSNVFTRRTLAGEFMVVNHHLVKDLSERGLWSAEMKNMIIAANGSVQTIPEIPTELKRLHKTAWEIPQRVILDMAADRSAFIDQSQSMNLYMREPTFAKLTAMHFYAWRKGLKTGMYYLRTSSKAQADKVTIQFTVDPVTPVVVPSTQQRHQPDEEEPDVCYPGKEGCDSCGA